MSGARLLPAALSGLIPEGQETETGSVSCRMVKMSLQAELERFTAVAEPVINDLGFVLVDVRFGQLGRKRSLEVTVFRPGGRIALADCETISRALDKELEQQQPPVVSGSFLLEVQSPGIDRQLTTAREFRVFAGQKVEVMAKEALGALGASFTGTLLSASQTQVSVGNPQPLATKTISKAKSKAAAGSAQPLPERVDIALARIIRVKLYPEMPKFSKTDDSCAAEGEELSAAELP